MLRLSRPTSHRRSTRKRNAGLSIIELLIGVAIGLFILAGASAMFVTNITSSRQLLLESRVNQELRTAMDLISRDLRRGAYWGNSLNGTSTTGSTGAAEPNPYSTITLTGGNQIQYAYSRDGTEDDTLDATEEQFGIRLNTSLQAIQMLVGGSWQSLSNPDVVKIPSTGLVITPTETSIDIRAACARTCSDTTTSPTCPRVLVRTYNVELTGVSATDSAVTRRLTSQVRVRNDGLVGSCPA